MFDETPVLDSDFDQNEIEIACAENLFADEYDPECYAISLLSDYR